VVQRFLCVPTSGTDCIINDIETFCHDELVMDERGTNASCRIGANPS
jgi:hypothetical protein